MAEALTNGMVLKTQVWSTYSNQACVNTVYFNVVTAGTPAATDQDLADLIDSNIATDYKTIIASPATYNGALVQIVSPGAVRMFVAATAGAGNGTAGATPLPTNVRGIVSLLTKFAGQRYRGRLYLPFPATTAQTGGVPKPSPAFQALMQLAVGDWTGITVISAGGRSALVAAHILHRKPLTGSEVITQIVARPYWAQQKRSGDLGRANVSPI